MILLATLDELKEFLEKTDIQHDALLESVLQRTSSKIETYLNRGLAKKSRVEYYDADRKFVHLSAYPIDETAGITVTLNGIAQTKNRDYYVWGDIGKVEWFIQPTYYNPKEICVTWTGGYATTTTYFKGNLENVLAIVPDDLKEACIIQAAYSFTHRRDLGINRISTPDGSVQTYSVKDFLPEVLGTLNRYRKTPSVR